MTDVETLTERVETVERAVTDGDHEFPAVDELSALVDRIETLEQQVEELEEQTAELEAATQALRGYVGNVRSVNERVEQRADTALAATERLEQRLDEHGSERRSPDFGESERRPVDAEQTDSEPPAATERTARTQTGREVRRGSERNRRTTTSDGLGREPVDTQVTETATQRGEDDDAGNDTGVLEQIRSLL